MTDRDAASRPPADPTPSASTSPSSDPTTSPSSGTALRDRWWWSPTLSIVIGLVVIGYQLDPLRGDNPLWGNWLVALLGAAVAGWGAVRLVRAARAR